MADIQLTFGIDPSSAASIKSGLDKLMAGLNPKLKFDVDSGKAQSAFKEYKRLSSEIQNVYREINKLDSGNNANKNVYIEQLSNQLKELEALRASFINDKTAPGYGTFTGAISDAKTFYDTLDGILARIQDVKTAFTAIEKGDYKGPQLLGADPVKLANTTSEVQRMINTITNLQDKLASGTSVASSGTKAELQDLLASLRQFSGEMGSLETDKASAKVANFRSQLTKLSGDVRSASSSFTGLFKGLGAGITNYIAMTFSAMRIIQTTVQEIKQMVNTAIELNSAFTQLQIVTRVSDSEMAQFSGTLADTAKNMSASVKDMAEVATVYARLGYSLDESNVLAQYTAMLQNVGDIDSGAASDALTAIVKAYGKGVDDIEELMDKMVTVGNNFPISVSQIAEGMNNAASMMANAGMTFDQSVALLTSANTTVQNISKSSTALRTIIARLRNVKSELDDAGEVWNEAKYQELISALTKGGVDLQEATGELRNPYEVLSELAAKWSSLSSDVRAAITTALAGTRQQDVFSSLMGQFQEATGAMEAMADSAGALESAYGIFEDSMQGHINKLKAAFEELSMEAVNKGFVNSVVDLGTSAIEVLTPIVGLLGDALSFLGPIGTTLATISTIGIVKNLDSSIEFVHYGCELIAA